MKKVIFTLDIPTGDPKKDALRWAVHKTTRPWLEFYAKRIGADLIVIEERKFPDYPVVYEKFQIYELAKGYERIIYVDSDALIHPQTVDFTELIPRDAIAHMDFDMANMRFSYDEYFRRDGRNIGSGTWLVFCSDWTLDIWQPLDIPLEEAVSRIQPAIDETLSVKTPASLIDDFTCSRNIAKYGLRAIEISEMQKETGLSMDFFCHQYTISAEDKVTFLENKARQWNLEAYSAIYNN